MPDAISDTVDPPFRPPEPGSRFAGLGWLAVLLLLAAAAFGWWWWHERPAPPPPAPAAAAVPPPPADPAPAEPAMRHPLELPEGLEPVAAPGLPALLSALLGADGMQLLQLEDFARRFAATVDNLGREHAPPLAWPVQPAPGRFTVQEDGDGARLAQANAQRYAAHLALLTRVSPAAAADVYRRIYPLLQQAWVELGMGQRYFNDRMVEVIDLLLATPQPASPPRLRLTEVKGPIASERPWVRWEYADARLESLAAGQKLLLRLGPDNTARVKEWLRAFRAEIAS